MQYIPHQLYHIYNQGNNRQVIFPEERNYDFFLQKTHSELSPYVDFLCYCLMPNHFHFLVYTQEAACQPSNAKRPFTLANMQIPQQNPHFQQNLSKAIGTLLSSYTRAINKQEGRSGSLFRNRTKVKDGWIEENRSILSQGHQRLFKPGAGYAKNCFQYIHQNPVKAKLVRRAEDWPYSSAGTYAGLTSSQICNLELASSLGLVPSDWSGEL